MIEIILYKNTAEPYVVDKTEYITEVLRLNGVFRDDTSVVDISLDVELNDNADINFNYIHIPKFNRYYFISDVISVTNKLWTINATVDVLMTYKEAILNSTGFVDRCEDIYNEYIIDDKRITAVGIDIESEEIENDIIVGFNALEIGSFNTTISGYNLSTYTKEN